jgi:branched-subunit amino acid aminotransferase/4-amino-4-deoxychorismate lyase
VDTSKVKESIIYQADLSHCTDAVLVNSIEGVVPVKSIGDYQFNNQDLWELNDE